jgi:hypothetical protein
VLATVLVLLALSLLSLLAMLQDACLLCVLVKQICLKIPLCTRPPSTGRVYLPVSLLSLLVMLQHDSFSLIFTNDREMR